MVIYLKNEIERDTEECESVLEELSVLSWWNTICENKAEYCISTSVNLIEIYGTSLLVTQLFFDSARYN